MANDWSAFERIRHSREILELKIDKTELNELFIRRKLICQNLLEGEALSVELEIVENRIKSLLCLK